MNASFSNHSNPVHGGRIHGGRIHGGRIHVIDSLRGFALIGIVVAHCANQYIAGAPAPGYNILFGPLDVAVSELGTYLTFGKFFTIFSFLFGLSFAIQMDRAADRNRPFVGRMLWRLVLLFAIGFVHSLFYSGDILRIYAFLGLFLILMRRLPNRAILIVGMLLVFNAPLLVGRINALNAPPPTPAQIEAAKAEGAAFMKMATEQYRIKSSGTLGEVVVMNAKEGLIGTLFFQLFTGRLFITLGLFLLGLYAGRRQLFADTPANRRFFRKFLWGSGLLALGSTALLLAMGGFTMGPPPPGWQGFVGGVAFDVHQATLSAFYVAAVTLLFWQTRTRFLHSLVAVGRMGLTIYLMQSLFGVLFFLGYGLGLVGKLGMAASVGAGLLFFALQIPFAAWWLSRYQFGPVEWLWRSLTYGKAQPWRKPKAESVVLV